MTAPPTTNATAFMSLSLATELQDILGNLRQVRNQTELLPAQHRDALARADEALVKLHAFASKLDDGVNQVKTGHMLHVAQVERYLASRKLSLHVWPDGQVELLDAEGEPKNDFGNLKLFGREIESGKI